MVKIEILPRFFVCKQCESSLPIGLDVEYDMDLYPNDRENYSGKLCVYCYNTLTSPPQNIDDCLEEILLNILYREVTIKAQLRKWWTYLHRMQKIDPAYLAEEHQKERCKLLEEYSEAIQRLSFNA